MTVEAIAQRLLEEGHRGIDVAVVTDDLRLCLLDALAAGLSQDEALSACAYIVEHMPEPTPTAPPPATEPPPPATEPPPPATEPPPPPEQPPPAEPTPCPPDSFSPLCGLQHR
jgi:outer membrane biosynthesis protein TonB